MVSVSRRGLRMRAAVSLVLKAGIYGCGHEDEDRETWCLRKSGRGRAGRDAKQAQARHAPVGMWTDSELNSISSTIDERYLSAAK